MMSYTRTYRRNTINQMKDKSKWTHFLVSRTFHFSVCRTVDSRNYDRDFFAFFSTLFWPNLFAAKTVSSANNGWRIRLGCGRLGGVQSADMMERGMRGMFDGCASSSTLLLCCSVLRVLMRAQQRFNLSYENICTRLAATDVIELKSGWQSHVEPLALDLFRATGCGRLPSPNNTPHTTA